MLRSFLISLGCLLGSISLAWLVGANLYEMLKGLCIFGSFCLITVSLFYFADAWEKWDKRNKEK